MEFSTRFGSAEGDTCVIVPNGLERADMRGFKKKRLPLHTYCLRLRVKVMQRADGGAVLENKYEKNNYIM